MTFQDRTNPMYQYVYSLEIVRGLWYSRDGEISRQVLRHFVKQAQKLKETHFEGRTPNNSL